MWCSPLLAAILALALAPPAARGEVATPAQARADDGTFLLTAPPPEHPASMCLVDTGVDLNADTERSVVDRLAIDGGSGDDASTERHGTLMAMMAGAPANGWGIIGAAPNAIHIISIRILEPGETSFPFRSYATAMNICMQLTTQYDVRVINLSLGDAQTPSSTDYEALSGAMKRAESRGIAVVSAAGNDDGGPVEYPAAYPTVLSVAATATEGGAFCSFSNRGPGLRLVAPGCELDTADPATGTPAYNYWQGTSEASAITAAALTAADSYRPGVEPAAVEEAFTSADSCRLDIAGAFRTLGLDAIVAAGEPAAGTGAPAPLSSSPLEPPQSMQAFTGTVTVANLPRPILRLQRTNHRLRLVFAAPPTASSHVEVRYLARRYHSRGLRLMRVLRNAKSPLRLPASGIAEVIARYLDPDDTQRTSTWTTAHIPPPSMDRRRLP